MAANWRTVVLRNVDQGPTHLAVLNADGPTDAGIIPGASPIIILSGQAVIHACSIGGPSQAADGRVV